MTRIVPFCLALSALPVAVSAAPAPRHGPMQPPPAIGNSAIPADQPAAPVRTITADPAIVAAIVRDAGLDVTNGMTAQGDPFIASKSKGIPFTIFFNNCASGRNCETVQFYAGFAVEKPRTLDLINQWNQQKRFAKAYIDNQNDPRLEMDVNLDQGGVAASNFADTLNIWLTLLNAFKQHIGWGT